MIAIEYAERIPCSYKDYACKETSCPFNVGHVPIESFFALSDIPSDRCLYVIDMILDEKLDIVIRNWVKTVWVDKKRMDIPPEVTELIERKAAEEIGILSEDF
jgi:hypothetical protein